MCPHLCGVYTRWKGNLSHCSILFTRRWLKGACAQALFRGSALNFTSVIETGFELLSVVYCNGQTTRFSLLTARTSKSNKRLVFNLFQSYLRSRSFFYELPGTVAALMCYHRNKESAYCPHFTSPWMLALEGILKENTNNWESLSCFRLKMPSIRVAYLMNRFHGPFICFQC